MTRDFLGEFEHLVLLAIAHLKDDAYGVAIRQMIEDRADRPVSFGAVYSTLRRLESKQLLETVDETPADGTGGRPRKHYRITTAGKRAVSASQRRLRRMAEGLPGL